VILSADQRFPCSRTSYASMSGAGQTFTLVVFCELPLYGERSSKKFARGELEPTAADAGGEANAPV
jgi:hypothetical protein